MEIPILKICGAIKEKEFVIINFAKKDKAKMEERASNEMSWDNPYYYFKSDRFIPRILDNPHSQLYAPFNSQLVSLDGRLKSDLNWRESQEQAQHYMEQGSAILWEIDLGLFSQLTLPLANQTQYLSLGLSLEHFRDTIWKDFKHQSLGLVLYRGTLNFSDSFHWNDEQESNLKGWIQDHFTTLQIVEEGTRLSFSSFNQIDHYSLSKSEYGRQLIHLFCRDVMIEYINLLASRLPDTLPRYLLLDAHSVENPLYQVQLLHPERFDQLNLAVKGAKIPLKCLGWEHASPYGVISQFDSPPIFPLPEEKIGICLPAMDKYQALHDQGIANILHHLLNQQIPFRLIPERDLITDWDGLDYLFYLPTGLSSQGKRKLQGFCAAGGTTVSLGEKLGLSHELSLIDFLDESLHAI
jgi:hypothetical protein